MRRRPLLSLMACIVLAISAIVVHSANDTKPDAVALFKGHKEAVYGVAFSPDGKFLITGSGDPAIKVWSIATGKEVKAFGGANGHKQLVLAVAMSPDGSQFATAGADNAVKVWDFPTDKHLRDFAASEQPRAVAVSTDGKRLAAGSKDGKIRVWNAEDGKQAYEIAAHSGAVTGVAFNGNNTGLVSVGVDGALRYWNAADGKAQASFLAHPGAVTGVAHAPSAPVVYTSGQDGTLRYWNAPTATRNLAAPLPSSVTGLSLSPDGNTILTAADKLIRLSAYTNGQTTKDYTASASVTSTALNPGNAFLAAGSTDGRLHLWQTKDGALLGNAVAHKGAITGVAFNGAGNQVVTSGKDGLVRLWAVPVTPTRTVTPGDVVRAAVMANDGKRLATGGADKVVRLYKLDNLKAPERQLTGHTASVNAVAFAPDGNSAVSGGDDEVIRFWSVAKGDQTATIGAHTGPITSLAYLGTLVLSSSNDGTVKLWNVPAAANKNGTLSHAGVVTSGVLSPDGGKLLTGCADKQVRLWNLATGQVERTWTGPTLGVQAVAISSKGDRVAAGSADKSVFVWEAGGNKEVQKFVNLPAAVQSVVLSGDGKHVVAGLADGAVRVLDLTTGKDAATFTGHKGAVNALAFNSKGELVYGGAEGVVVTRGLAAPKEASSWAYGSAIHAIAVSRDGAKIAAGGAGKDIKVFTAATGKVEATISTPAEVRGLAYSGDGKRLAVAGGDGKSRVYLAEGHLEEIFAHEGAVHAAAFGSDNRRIVTASADKTARVWPLSLVWQGKHDGAVKRAVVNNRGDRVLSAGQDGIVRIWQLSDGKLMQSIRAHTGAVDSLIVTPDSTRILTGGADKVVRVWDWAKMPATQAAGKDVDKPASQLTLPGAPEGLTLSPDGKRLAVGIPGDKPGTDRVHIFDATTMKELMAAGDPDGLPARSLGFLADSRTLLAAGGDKNVQLVDINILGSFAAHPGGVAGVAWHSNGTQILTAGADKSAKLWTIATGNLDRTFALPEAASSVGFSRDFAYAAATAGKTLKIWNVADGKELFSFDLPATASALSFNQDRTRVATANSDGKARVWDLTTKKEAQAYAHTGAVTGVAFHPAQAAQLVSGGEDKNVGIHTVSIARLINAGSPINALAYSPNQQHVLTAAQDGKVTFWNLGNGNADRTFAGPDKGSTSVAVSRNGFLVAVGGADKTVKLIGYNDAKLLSSFTAPAEIKSLSFSGNNQALVGLGGNGSVTTWDVTYNLGQPVPAEFGKVLQSASHGTEGFDGIFPVAGAVFYTAGGDKNVRAWKVASDAPTKNLQHPQSVNCLAFTKDGNQMITGAADGRVRFFDVAKGTPIREIAAHATPNQTAIYCVAFSPDEKSVISGSIDQTLKLWNAADGKLIREFKAYKDKEFPKGHQDAVLSVAFSPDGKQVASGSMDRTIKIWNVADGSVVRELTNPAFKPAVADVVHPSHPGWVYGLRWVAGGKKLVSVGQAPKLRGYLAMWEPDTGKLLSGKELTHGSVFALAVSPDEKFIALGTGGSVRTGEELNLGVVLKMPE